MALEYTLGKMEDNMQDTGKMEKIDEYNRI